MPENGQSLDLSITLGNASFQASGPADLVMQAFAEFKGFAASAPAVREQPAPEAKPKTTADGNDDSAAEDTAATPPAPEKVPLPKFLESDAIKGNPAIATAIVVWAEDHEGKQALTRREMEGYWKGTKLKVPGNTARDVGVAVRKGWLLKGEGNTYSASGYGREAIGLPAS